jgi:hypothetical protein
MRTAADRKNVAEATRRARRTLQAGFFLNLIGYMPKLNLIDESFS